MHELWKLEPVPPKTANIRMLESDVMVQSVSSGGGYGDPIQRDPELVLKDVTAGAISAEVASRIYGVIVKRSSAGRDRDRDAQERNTPRPNQARRCRRTAAVAATHVPTARR